MAQGEQEQAVECFNQTLKIANEIDWQHCKVSVRQFLADIAEAQGMFDQAESLLKTGLRIAARNKEKELIICDKNSLKSLALQQLTLNKQDERDTLDNVIGFVRQATEDFEHLKNADDLRPVLKSLQESSSFPTVEEGILSASLNNNAPHSNLVL